MACRSSAAVAVLRTFGAFVGEGFFEGAGDLVGSVVGDDVLVLVDEGLGVGAAEVGVASLVLAGGADVDSPVPAVGSAALRSFSSSAASKIPVPRTTMAKAAASPRLRLGLLGGGTGLAGGDAGTGTKSGTGLVEGCVTCADSGTAAVGGLPVERSAMASATSAW